MTVELESQLLSGIASALNGETVTYRSVGTYTDSEFGVYFQGSTMLADQGLVIRHYPVQDSVSDADLILGVQFEIRSKSVDLTLRVANEIRALLHRAWNVTLGGVLVSQSFRQSGSTSDADGRVTRTENYYITVNRPN